VALLTALLLAGFGPAAQADANYHVGDAVEFSMVTADGDAFTSQQLQGRLVVVEFWATWCGPCIRMIPHLKQMHREYEDRGVTMISVSTDRNPDDARRMIRRERMNWVMVLNAEQRRSLTGQFFSGSFGIPHAFLISPDGNLLWNGHPAHLEAEIQKALEEHPPSRRGRGGTVDDTQLLASGDAELIARTAGKLLRERRPDFERLLTLAAALPDDDERRPKVDYFGRSAKRVLDRLDAEATDAYVAARTANPDGAAALDRWLGVRPSASAGPSASDTPTTLAAQMYERARAAHERGELIRAYDAYSDLLDRLPTSDEALRAHHERGQLEADPDFVAAYEKQTQERAAQNQLVLAENFFRAELEDKARKVLRQLIEDYPETEAAKQARQKLR
jgi:thiol-disulfide isomerase/thioredoxin